MLLDSILRQDQGRISATQKYLQSEIARRAILPTENGAAICFEPKKHGPGNSTTAIDGGIATLPCASASERVERYTTRPTKWIAWREGGKLRSMSQTLEHVSPNIRPFIRIFALGAISAGCMRVVAVGLAFASTLAMARFLGFGAFGEFAFATATFQIATVIAKLGFDNTSLRFVAQYRELKKDGLLWAMVSAAANYSGLASCGVAALIAAIALLLSAQLGGQLSTCLLFSAVVAAILPLTQVYEAMLVALGCAVQGLISPILTPLLFIGCVLGANRVWGTALNSPTAMLLYAAATLASFLVARALLRNSLRKYKSDGRSFSSARHDWLAMALPMMALNVLVYVQGQSGTLLSGLFLGTEGAGLYATVSRIAGVALFGLQSINIVAAPRMAALHGMGKTSELQQYVQLCSWGSLAFALPLAILFGLLGRPILFLFGQEFVAGYGPLLILLLALVVNAATGSVAQLLYMTGHHSTCLRLCAVMAAVALVLQIALIPQFGVMGAAITTAVIQVVWNLVLVHMARAKLGLWSLVSISLLMNGPPARQSPTV